MGLRWKNNSDLTCARLASLGIMKAQLSIPLKSLNIDSAVVVRRVWGGLQLGHRDVEKRMPLGRYMPDRCYFSSLVHVWGYCSRTSRLHLIKLMKQQVSFAWIFLNQGCAELSGWKSSGWDMSGLKFRFLHTVFHVVIVWNQNKINIILF